MNAVPFIPKYTLEDMQKMAAAKNGCCLSKEYWDVNTPLTWRCEQGHTFEITPLGLKHGHWCTACVPRKHGKKKLTITQMHQLAETRGGKCLSTEYVNNSTKLEWQCKKGHKWKATPSMIKNGGGSPEIRAERIWQTTPSLVKSAGTWCPYCAGLVKFTLQQMQRVAKRRGGKCLSTEYINAGFRLEWECNKGHKWQATASAVYQGSWCKACLGFARLTIEEMQEIAASREGKCLSTVYFNNNTKMEWECKQGHTWQATAHAIKSGQWCPVCAIERTRKSPK